VRYVAPYGTTDPNSPYRNGDSRLGIQGSIPPAEAFESPMREIVNLINYSGFVPSSDDLAQLTRGVRSQAINFAVDTGSTNNLSVNYTPVIVELTDGLPLRVLVAHTNTGPSNIAVNNLVAAAIHRADGSNLQAGDLVAGEVACLVFDGQFFQLMNFLGIGGPTINNNYYDIGIPYCLDTGTPNLINAIFAPPITSLAAGDPFLVQIANANTGPTNININSISTKDVFLGDLSELVANQIVPGMIAFFIFDGTRLQLINPVLTKAVAAVGVQIAKRLVYQDPSYHISTVYNVFVEAFRVTFAPVSAGDDVYISMVGAFNSEEVNTNPIGRAIDGYVAYSTDGGTTWNPPSWPGYDFPGVGTFKANPAIADFVEGAQHINPGIQRVDYNFMIAGQMTVPSGAPNIVFKLMFVSAHKDSPTTMVHGGTIVEITEYKSL